MSTKPVYRPILKRALKIVWERKILWVLGIFASILNTGAVFTVGFRALQPVQTEGGFLTILLTNIIPGFASLHLYISQFIIISPLRAVVTLLVILIITIAFMILSVYSQGGLIKGVLSHKALKTNQLFELPKNCPWRIFSINLTAKVCVALLLALSAVPLALLATNVFMNLLASFVVLLFFVIVILIISLIALLAIASTVQDKTNLIESIEQAFLIFKKHPLVTFETALLLLLIHFIGVALALVVILALWLPYTVVFFLATLTGITFLTTIVSIIITIIGLIIILGLTGFMVAYQFAVWAIVFEKLKGRGLIPKLHRFKKTFRLL
ncbi:MAG: hypothetical protein ABIH67_05280 [Candidatus Uhrbacteria bacterium]